MGGLTNCLSIVNYIQSCLNHISSNFTFLNDYIEYIKSISSFSYNNNICKKRQNIGFYDSVFVEKKRKNNNGIVKHFNNHNNNNKNNQEDDWGWFVVLD